MSFVRFAVRPEILPITIIGAGAVAIAGAHLFKLARDPHTPYMKYVCGFCISIILLTPII
jgi:hypothetical protein